MCCSFIPPHCQPASKHSILFQPLPQKTGKNQAFYGEGKRVRGIFLHVPTGHSAAIYPGGARDLSALWSPDSHYVALTADRTKYRCEVKLFRVERGRIAEIALPLDMDASKYLS